MKPILFVLGAVLLFSVVAPTGAQTMPEDSLDPAAIDETSAPLEQSDELAEDTEVDETSAPLEQSDEPAEDTEAAAELTTEEVSEDTATDSEEATSDYTTEETTGDYTAEEESETAEVAAVNRHTIDAAGYLHDLDGNFIGFMDEDRSIYDQNGGYLGHMDEVGDIYAEDGTLLYRGL
jgi:hypothetical protein